MQSILQEEEKKEPVKEKKAPRPPREKTKVFINGELHIERIDTAEQSFTLTGWINFFWRGDHAVTRSARSKYDTYGPRDNIWRDIDDEANYEAYAEKQEEGDKTNETDAKDERKEEEMPAGGKSDAISDLVEILKEKFLAEEPTPKRLVDVKKKRIYKPFGGSKAMRNFSLTFGGNGNEVESLRDDEEYYGLRFAELYKKDENGQLVPTAINTEMGVRMDGKHKENKCLFWQHVHFRGTFDEFFEMEEFPFDKQFLNVPFKFRASQYQAVDEPEQLGVQNVKMFPLDEKAKCMEPVRCKKIDSVWTSEWELLEPWIVFEGVKNTSAYDFAVIKLRVVRSAQHYIWFTLAPVFLITSCIFCIWYLVGGDPMDEINNRLAVVFTLLLTIQASQIAAAEGMPHLPTTTIVDRYIAISILLQVMTIPFVIISATAFDIDTEHGERDKWLFELAGGLVFGGSWITSSLYAFGGFKLCKCSKKCTQSWKDRLAREDEEMEKDVTNFKVAKKEHIRCAGKDGFQFPNDF